MKNVSLKLPLLIFFLVITSNLGAEARKLTGVDDTIIEVDAASPQYVAPDDTLNKAPSCKRDIDCSFQCPKGGFCNQRLGRCECL
ncbi:hypothetical protein ISN45_Aa03g027350 [Arabidopsis thaliana x Arabidopsis arenosa]|uniref:Uncharacterized protein n=1 Tax=Arabidopsis thaliana x Arabidopsis arenosa TaxID=1240361 RepID=A0A8T2AWN9_9BRAS|nr:hypothetical protein ISN45_Aa03g027350 [Arabidopsis thaliana x Arabidopsis arenosa]